MAPSWSQCTNLLFDFQVEALMIPGELLIDEGTHVLNPGRRCVTLVVHNTADRPIQVTADLPGFWSGSWIDVKKDIAGRYPKHQWPDDPANADPKRMKDR
jgi:HrpA-like RNA helicase